MWALIFFIVLSTSLLVYFNKLKKKEEQASYETISDEIITSQSEMDYIMKKINEISVLNDDKSHDVLISEYEETGIEEELVWHRNTRVRGTSFREGGLKLLEFHNIAMDNEPFDGQDMEDVAYFAKEWELEQYMWSDFKTTEFELVPEPDNPVDSNALKVVVEGFFIGYICKGYAKQLQKYVTNDDFEIFGIASVYGGPYKYWDRGLKDGKKNVGCKINLKVRRK